jgi:RNA polymerase sigma factor (sigma-70 family)
MSAVSGEERQQALVAPGVRPPLAVPRRLLRMRSDATLAERFAAGDEAAFDVIYERHRPVVLAVCMGVLGTPPDAEDATQETFSALAVVLRTRPPAELRPWLIRVARNASIDTTRRRRHRLLTLDGEIPEIAARPAGPGQAELAVVLDGIRELPEGQRMALLMRELGGHSYAEIADFLATDEEAVKGLIARARVGLRTYREATELSCASARNTIAAEPDGRRYDKTIRRHLRSCASCRAYREALRDDAKALRAALPIQAGAVATGSLSTGMLTAAKGTLLGYGLTQAATTCAASACAVGAIGGMVFVAPVHRFGLSPILPATPVVHHHTAAVKAPVKHTVTRTHTVASVSHSGATTSHGSAPTSIPATTTAKPVVTHRAAVLHHHEQHTTITHVVLPRLPKHHSHGSGVHRSGVPVQTAADNAGTGNQGQGNAYGNQGQSNAYGNQAQSQSDQGQGNQGNGNGHGYGSWKHAAQDSGVPSSQVSAASSDQDAPGAPVQSTPAATVPATHGNSGQGPRGSAGHGQGNADHGQGTDQGRWGGNGHAGNHHTPTATVASASNGSPAAPPATSVTSTASSPTTSTVGSPQAGAGWGGGHGHGHGWGNGHGSGTQAAAGQNSASTQPGAPTITINYGAGGSNGNGGPSSNGYGSGSNGNGHGWGHGN